MVVQGNVAQTVENIPAHGRIFVAAILCYLFTIFLDVVIAWVLYYLLAPVNRALSMLAAWFRLVYVAIFFVASLNLVACRREFITSIEKATAVRYGRCSIRTMKIQPQILRCAQDDKLLFSSAHASIPQ